MNKASDMEKKQPKENKVVKSNFYNKILKHCKFTSQYDKNFIANTELHVTIAELITNKTNEKLKKENENGKKTASNINGAKKKYFKNASSFN